MSTTKRVGVKRVWLVSAVVLLLLGTLFGCSFLAPHGSGDGWYMKLNVNPPARAKAIAVSEYDVTGLVIEVHDPEGALIQQIDWQAEEGAQSYLIPVSEAGQHEIAVTHIGERNGEAVQAEESVLFNIQAMVITVIDITPGAIGTINVEAVGQEPKADGTISVQLTGAEEQNGKIFAFGVVPAGGSFADFLGADTNEIVDGGALGIALDGEDPVIFTGGESYDVVAAILADPLAGPAPGDYVGAQAWRIVVDGDMLVTLVYPDDFTEYTQQ